MRTLWPRTNSNVGINGGEEAGAYAMMVILFVGYMQTSSGIAELLREAEIDDVDKVRVLAYTHDEVCRFDVAMDEIPRVDVFDARYLQ